MAWYDEYPMLPSLSVEDVPAFTGLLDGTGNPIYRSKNPLGFGRDKEWKKQKDFK